MKNTMSKNFCSINLEHLSIKAHYFFLFGAMGGVMPFIPVVAKNLGFNATDVGIIFTVMPFCVMLSKPIFGYFADYIQDFKIPMLILGIFTCLAYSLVVGMNFFKINQTISVLATCSNNSDELTVLPLLNSCSFKRKSTGIKCVVSILDCHLNISGEVFLDDETLNVDHHFINSTRIEDVEVKLEKLNNFTFKPAENNFTCDCFTNNASVMVCESFVCETSKDETLYICFFAVMAIVAVAGTGSMFSLTDAVCCDILNNEPKLYGQQRIWASVAWGVVTSFAGFLNDLVTGDSPKIDFSSGLYLMFIFLLFDAIIFFKMRFKFHAMPEKVWRRVWKTFLSCETVIFAAGVYVIGGLTGLVWSYQLWFLEDLGASQTLLGLVIAVQCVFAEIPFFFFSGWIINKFGHFNCIFASIATFALRYILYYSLVNPWLTLPIEVLHGFTYALFYSTMISYASITAPDGTQSTLIGILGGIFEGLGVATGSLLGGVGIDIFGGHKTFLCASIISSVCLPALVIPYVIIKVLNKSVNTRSNNNRDVRPRPN